MVNILAFEDDVFAADLEELEGDQPASDRGLLASTLPIGVELDPRFRERYFGDLDGTPLPNYDKIWPRDLQDPTHTDFDVESVYSVAARVLSAVTEYETQTCAQIAPRQTGLDSETVAGTKDVDDGTEEEGTCVVVVSHADTLQITQLAIAGVDLGKFSQYRFRNGEVRQIWASPDCLPDPVPLTFR